MLRVVGFGVCFLNCYRLDFGPVVVVVWLFSF